MDLIHSATFICSPTLILAIQSVTQFLFIFFLYSFSRAECNVDVSLLHLCFDAWRAEHLLVAVISCKCLMQIHAEWNTNTVLKESTHTRPRFNQIYNSFINAIHSNPHLNWLNAKCILCKYCICSVWRTHPLIKILITLNVTVQWRWAAAAQHTWIASPYLHAHIFHVRLAAATDECNESTS